MIKNAFILNFLKLYNMLWKLTRPFLKKNKRLRLGFNKRSTSTHHTKADIWIQAASAGEAYLAVNIIKTLEPAVEIKVLVTSMTSQGMDILKKDLVPNHISKKIDLKIEWFPFDMPDVVKGVVKKIDPKIMVLLETEIWPALLYYLKKNQTRILIINARLSKKSFSHYMKTQFLWKHLGPHTILATSKQDAQRYKKVFMTSRVGTMSNIKFETIKTDRVESDRKKIIKSILPSHKPLTILASIRKKEEKEMTLLIKEILLAFPDQVVAIFPRHMHRISALQKHLNALDLTFVLRSQITEPVIGPGIILWDTFGELQTAYGFASVVFVGGSLKPLGGQNFLEPVIQGAVTITGPYYDDFAWVTDDIFNKSIVLKKDNRMAIAKAILKTLEFPIGKSALKHKAQNYIKSHRGGTCQACNEILKAFDGFI